MCSAKDTGLQYVVYNVRLRELGLLNLENRGSMEGWLLCLTAQNRIAEEGEPGFSRVFIARGQEAIVTICSKCNSD